MGFLADKEQKRYFRRLALILTAASILAASIWYANGAAIKAASLRHDTSVVSSLLEQGISEAVIARAFSQQSVTEKGAALLLRMGIGEDTEFFFLPGIMGIQEKTGLRLVGLILFLWGSLLLLTVLFFSAREQLYEDAGRIIGQFMREDFSQHLPRMDEGCLSRLFGRIDALANALAAENEKAMQARDFLKDTIADISHQLKTPLAALVMYHEIIETEASSDTGSCGSILAFTGKASAALERIEALIRTLLKVTRLDAGAVLFEKQRYLLSDVAAKAVSELLVRAKEEKKEILLTGDENVRICCDLQWTGEALGNLVKNALDHTESGGRITLSWEKLPESVRISVADNGSGIQEKDIYHIFKRFYRSCEGNPKDSGIGLGLPLAKSIAEGQGGTLSVRSRVSEGSVFTMTLPD